MARFSSEPEASPFATSSVRGRYVGPSSTRSGYRPRSLRRPPRSRAAFLRGLFGADGCVSWTETNRYVGPGSRRDALLRDVQRL